MLTIDPELLSAHIQLGHTYNHLGEIDKAIQAYENALKLQPHSANLHYNLGYTQRHIRKFDEAINHFKKALALKPDYKNAHISLAVSYWLTEQFDLSQKEFIKAWTDIKNATTPLWDGSNLKGKTIFLRGAFGLGDTIQYIRYAKELKEQGAKIYCQVQKPIANLLEHYPYVDAFVTAKPNGCDYQALLPNLPVLCKTTPKTTPAAIPYLKANEKLKAAWHMKLNGRTDVKIGLCCFVDPKHDEEKLPIERRNIPLDLVAELGSIKHISFYGLQKIDPPRQSSGQASTPPNGSRSQPTHEATAGTAGRTGLDFKKFFSKHKPKYLF